jgi:hypothetical protein
VDSRITRLVAAVEMGGNAASLVTKIKELEARKEMLDTDLRALRPVPRLAPEVIENRLTEWRRLLRSSVTQGRTVLQRILRGRLTFTLRQETISTILVSLSAWKSLGMTSQARHALTSYFPGWPVSDRRPCRIPRKGARTLILRLASRPTTGGCWIRSM